MGASRAVAAQRRPPSSRRSRGQAAATVPGPLPRPMPRPLPGHRRESPRLLSERLFPFVRHGRRGSRSRTGSPGAAPAHNSWKKNFRRWNVGSGGTSPLPRHGASPASLGRSTKPVGSGGSFPASRQPVGSGDLFPLLLPNCRKWGGRSPASHQGAGQAFSILNPRVLNTKEILAW